MTTSFNEAKKRRRLERIVRRKGTQEQQHPDAVAEN